MDAALSGLIGAVIGALAGLAGAVITTMFQFRLEHQKWLRTRSDQSFQDLQLAIAKLTKLL